MSSDSSGQTKTCPKCTKGCDYPFQHLHQMIDTPFYPYFNLRDEKECLLPWKSEFSDFDDAVPLPKMYVCPDCGYTEWYHSSSTRMKNNEENSV